MTIKVQKFHEKICYSYQYGLHGTTLYDPSVKKSSPQKVLYVPKQRLRMIKVLCGTLHELKMINRIHK